MNALMTISIGGSALLGEWEEAAVVVTLFALANHLEARSLDRARRATLDLFAASPELAVVRVGGPTGEERTVPAEEVRPGDTLIVRPGERVPVDAVIHRGTSEMNEALLTGESSPVEKKEGDPIYAGTVNGRGLLIATTAAPSPTPPTPASSGGSRRRRRRRRPCSPSWTASRPSTRLRSWAWRSSSRPSPR